MLRKMTPKGEQTSRMELIISKFVKNSKKTYFFVVVFAHSVDINQIKE